MVAVPQGIAQELGTEAELFRQFWSGDGARTLFGESMAERPSYLRFGDVRADRAKRCVGSRAAPDCFFARR